MFKEGSGMFHLESLKYSMKYASFRVSCSFMRNCFEASCNNGLISKVLQSGVVCGRLRGRFSIEP